MTKHEFREAAKARMVSDSDIFIKRLNEAISDSGQTKQALADDGVVSRETLNNYIYNNKMPSARTLQVLASYLGVSCDYLLGLTNVKERARNWIFVKGMWCCPYCNEAGEPGDRFCPNCGKRIDVE